MTSYLIYVTKFAKEAQVKIPQMKSYITKTHYLINKRHGSQMLEQMIWPSNHTFHTKVYFNEFVANALLDNMGMIIFDL